MTDTPNGVAPIPAGQVLNGSSLGLIARGAVEALGAILTHGVEGYLQDPRFQDGVRKLITTRAAEAQTPTPPGPVISPLYGCPWCASAHHLAGTRAYIENAFVSKYPQSFLGWAHKSAVELMGRCHLTGNWMQPVYEDLQPVAERLWDLKARVKDGERMNPAVVHELQSILTTLRDMGQRCFRASEGGQYREVPPPDPHAPEQLVPEQSNGTKRK